MDNKCKAIHETSLGHIIDIWNSIKDIKDLELDKIKNGKKQKGPLYGSSSIANASSNLTMVFPVLCSRAISIDHASMVSKAVEKNAVSMLQRLFASWQIAEDESFEKGVSGFKDYLNFFHQNLSSKVMDLDDAFKVMDMMKEAELLNSAELHALKEDLSNLNFYLPNPISESSLSRFVVKEGAVSDIGYDSGDEKHKKPLQRNPNEKTDGVWKDKNSMIKNSVLDSEYKKANELMPTTMTVNFKLMKNGVSDPIEYDSCLAAVKAKLYPISSEDIITHVSDKVSDKNWITNFIRASTREISFMKDFVLALDKAKIDAISLSDRRKTSDKLWKVLERRALTAKLKKSMLKYDNASVAAITTLCISQEEVEYLRKNNNIDIERIGVVRALFESLNLMCICIVDESLEVAKFIYDEDEPMWETISFTHLERESSDNTYKRVVNLMTKMSR